MTIKDLVGASVVSRFRYLGHRQSGTLRELSFGDMGKDGIEHLLNLRIDIGLLMKHHLRIQDIPDICLRILAERWTNTPVQPGPPTAITISEEDLSRLAGEQEEKIAAKRAKKPRSPAPKGTA